MTCSNCKTDQPNGRVIDDNFYCSGCILNGMVKKIVKKNSNPDSMIIAVLIREIGIPQDVAKGYFNNPGITIESLIKYVWLFRFLKYKKYRFGSPVAFMRDLIANGNKYPPSDEYREWYKNEMQNPRKNDFEILYRSI